MKPILEDLAARVQKIVNAPDVRVVPVGDASLPDRGIRSMASSAMGNLGAAVKMAFAGVVVVSTLTMPQHAHASGVGYDAGVYGQAQGQVMHAAHGVPMEVLDVRPVAIELAAQPQQQNNTMRYAITTGSGALGAIVGNRMGGNSDVGRQIGSILGGVAGVIGGEIANNVMNGPSEPKRVAGMEISLRNPATKQTFVVTQAGDQQFSRGDRVLVVSGSGATRVIPDAGRSHEVSQAPAYSSPGAGPAIERLSPADAMAGTVADIAKTARTLGLQLDPRKIAQVLESGQNERVPYIGKVAGVDPDSGLVYQDLGMGRGTVHVASSLSRVPRVGESVTIRYNNGQGTVIGRELAQGHGHGR